MDFGIQGSDCWESDAFQDEFIRDYFGNTPKRNKESPDTGEKKTETRRKRSNENLRTTNLCKSLPETVVRPKKKKKKKQKSCEEDKDFVKEDKDFVKEDLSSVSELEESMISNKSHSPSFEKGENQINLKKKTRRGKRRSKSNASNLGPKSTGSSQSPERVPASLRNGKGIKRSESFKDKLKNLKNKFKLHKTSSSNEAENFISSSMTNLDPLSEFERQKKHVEFLPSLPRSVRSNVLRERAQKMLQAAKFRMLNEKLYSGTGREAMKFFSSEKDAFQEYHKGYQLQVSKWPINPVDLIIGDLRKVSNDKVIADLGCGAAKIAETFPDRTVYSYDLVSVNENVIRCDISKVPLLDSSVDVAIFCLSLMGTNLNEYILEAHRILKNGGILKIAEVESRIDDIEEFVKSIAAYGFQLFKKDISHKMFLLLDFHKTKVKLKKEKLPAIVLSPCLYKKR